MRGGIRIALLVMAVGVACSDLDGLTSADNPSGVDGGAGDATTSDSGGDNGDSAGGGDSASGVTIAEACAKVAEAFCSRENVCGPSIVQSFYGGPIACEAQIKLACEIHNAAPGVMQTAVALTQCATDTQASSCEDIVSGKAADSCRPVGSVPVGGSCITDVQCATRFCAELDGSGCGRCQVPLGVDQPCGSPGCDRGLVCGSGGKCIVPRTKDQICQGGLDCGRTLECGPGNTCVPYRMANDACGTGVGNCSYLQTYGCHQDTSTCVKQVAIAPGMTCMNINGVSPICLGGLCRANGTTPVCTAFAKEGEACAGLPCIEPLKCVSGQCVKPKMALCPL